MNTFVSAIDSDTVTIRTKGPGFMNDGVYRKRDGALNSTHGADVISGEEFVVTLKATQ